MAVLASYPSTSPANFAVTAMPGLSVNIQGAPAVGDVLSIDPKVSVFSVLDDAIRDIGNAANSNAATQAVGQALHNVDIGMPQLASVRGQAGRFAQPGRQDQLQPQDKRSIQVESDRSRAQDLDMVRAYPTSRISKPATRLPCGPTRRCRNCRCSISSAKRAMRPRHGPVICYKRKRKTQTDPIDWVRFHSQHSMCSRCDRASAGVATCRHGKRHGMAEPHSQPGTDEAVQLQMERLRATLIERLGALAGLSLLMLPVLLWRAHAFVVGWPGRLQHHQLHVFIAASLFLIGMFPVRSRLPLQGAPACQILIALAGVSPCSLFGFGAAPLHSTGWCSAAF